VQYVLALPDTPPSFNAVGHSGSRWKWTRAKRDWQRNFETLLRVERVPRELPKVTAAAVLRFPTAVRRDVVNYRTILEKCLGDALVNGGWLEDDTPEFFAFGSIEFAKGPKQTTLILTVPD
jgi:hypothetical protein